MNLPELDWQIVYGHVAWALVLAALACALVPAARRHGRGAVALALVAALAANALPGEMAPSWWLVLAFQLPSGLLTGICAARLFALWQGRAPAGALPPLLPPMLALPLAMLATVLYLDTMGVLELGWYYRGFGPLGAPVVAVLLAIGAAWAAVRGIARPYAVALVAALCTFSLLRLPSGNLWDALLDPFLAAWALVSLASIGLKRWRRRATRPA